MILKCFVSNTLAMMRSELVPQTSPLSLCAESYIDHYTLNAHIEGRSGAPLRLDAARIRVLLGDLFTLEESSGRPWGAAASEAYQRSFGVSLKGTVRGGGPRVLGDVVVSFSIPCVVPPWKGGAGSSGGYDYADPLHERAVQALVRPILLQPSLTAGPYYGDPRAESLGGDTSDSLPESDFTIEEDL